MPIVGAFIVPHPPIILPEVGRGQEKIIQKTINAYNEVAKKIAALRPDTIIITSPHSVTYYDYFHISPGKEASGDLKSFGVQEVAEHVMYDSEFVRVLSEIASKNGIRAGTMGEKNKSLDHGTLIPLRFINKYYKGCKVVRIGLSGLDSLKHYGLGMCIKKAADTLGKRAVIVASGDLSHKLKEDGPYGFSKEGPQFDEIITKAMAQGDFLEFFNIEKDFAEAAAQCGLGSFLIMAGTLDKTKVKAKFLSYEGPFGVGYAVCAFEPQGDDKTRNFYDIYQEQVRKKMEAIKKSEDEYVTLARLCLESYIKDGVKINRPQSLPKEMVEKAAGVFVSLKKHGQLRGCIGTIAPTTPCVADEILRNAIAAATEDPRFDPVEKDELDDIVYSVDVLSPPENIASMEALDTKRFGVIVTSGYKRGLLLPNLDGIDTPQQQVDIARQKAGIGPREKYSLQRFEVVRHT